MHNDHCRANSSLTSTPLPLLVTPPQFIDLCILLGCDYCGTIKGIGPKRAIDLIRQHGCIEEILENIDPNVRSQPAQLSLLTEALWVGFLQILYSHQV